MSSSSSFHLRPVATSSPSPSPTVSSSDRTSPPFTRVNVHPRRPLSPTSLRDLDLTNDTEMAHRKYPAPPTGHELMALFPPAPPSNFPGVRPGPTSDYFHRQERAFFAQAGKEIVRVRVEVDLPQDVEMEDGQTKAQTSTPRQWPPGQHTSPVQTTSPGASLPYPHPNNARPARPPVPTAIFSPHGPTLHELRMPPQDTAGAPKVEYHPDEYRDNPDEAWRRPMPYNERRRAGKHTRRVIVRN